MIASMIRAALSQRLVVVVLALVMCGFGLRAAMNLSVDAFPDVTNVQVQVATEAPGRSPEEIERFVTVPLEIAMTGLPGLAEMRSLNKSGLSIITLVFTDATDVYFARQLVTERLIEVTPRMPEGIVPVLGPVSTGLGEVYQYTLDHPDDGKRELTQAELTERRTIQDWVARPLLRSIPGVAEINSQGGYVKQYQVLVDPARLRHYNLSVRQVVQAVADNNANASGGILPQVTEQYLIRGVGMIRTLDDIGNIVLKEQGGVPVYVRDVAKVQIDAEVRQGAIIKGGYTEGVSGIVLMMRGGNAKEVVTRVKERVEEINSKGMLPGGLQIVPYYDRTDLVDSALWTVGKVLIEGIFLVVVVLFIFLGDVRSSLIVVATLIITPLTTFIMMNKYGISANLMSLGGLAIAIGLMVDATVVVVENVFHKLGQAGNSRGERIRTVLSATVEVATPTIFGIAIIILVFLPLMTLQGIEGKMFGPLALTIAMALAISLAVSLFLSPVLCSYFLKGGADHDTKLIGFLKRHYLRLLDGATARNRLTLAVAVALLIGSLGLFPFLGKSFMPTMKEGALTPQINRVPSISLDESIRMEMAAMKEVAQVPGVKSVVSKLGRGESPADPAGPNESDPIVLLDPESERTQDEIDEEIRQRLSKIPGVQIVLSQPISERVDEMVTGVRSQLAVKVFGDELEDLKEVSEQVARILKSVSGSTDIRIERLSGQQALTVDIDRKAIARHGLNVADVQSLLESAIGGKDVTTLYEGERRYSVVVRFPESYRGSPEAIGATLLTTAAGAQVPLSSLARIELVDGPAQISREGGKRRVVVGANVEGRDLAGFVAEVEQRLDKEVKLPDGYYFKFGGQFENMERAMGTLQVIVPLTIVAIFFLLFLLFNSIKLASLIILVLPFASIGGLIGLFVTGEYVSVPASVGFIALWGIAVLNGVVLVSSIRQLRQDGMDVAEAVREGCTQRFRPVMMTATVALLGLVPFLFATGPGSEVQRPLAIVVIGGLITSTLLTLVVLPTLYRWFDEKPTEA
ncbi:MULTISPECIES: efflux RND transporter permease subunit [Comamonas]|uniref:Cytochrome-c peroxidase n=2 Tax=Comamonas TaxID=283 RepID=A0A1Y1J803_COMTE|nr:MULTISPECIES: CusA/CzcA family heavy metal efflux RND transporter [Comamonas]EFI63765.1 Co/Zn/Cd efflux pump protein CzcA [Comamonas thiooxydans]KKI11715.1 cytochrome C peroxidase [Comamonas thiooxydans]MBL5980568.1 efflux RND transporter permease subunit [Comamonas sp. NyZ500]MDH1255572.1 CusA/CzcA family heavy metal efflux RND transporter [Comamonas thiooxydans]MDH1337268.1 CusA/CzcA family heavy metal efflux RND transporter [Comamonas thiooxydans]